MAFHSKYIFLLKGSELTCVPTISALGYALGLVTSEFCPIFRMMVLFTSQCLEKKNKTAFRLHVYPKVYGIFVHTKGFLAIFVFVTIFFFEK